MKKRYIVVDTWNGDGYSDENGTMIKTFNTKMEAFENALEGVKQQHDATFEAVKIFSRNLHLVGGYIFESGNDAGSFQVFELNEDIYAVEILCNVNEVSLLTKDQHEEAIEQREEEISAYTTYDSREDYVTENNGDTFYSAVEEYDFQYRLIKNK